MVIAVILCDALFGYTLYAASSRVQEGMIVIINFERPM